MYIVALYKNSYSGDYSFLPINTYLGVHKVDFGTLDLFFVRQLSVDLML